MRTPQERSGKHIGQLPEVAEKDAQQPIMGMSGMHQS